MQTGIGGGGGLIAKLCPTLWDPMDCSLPGSSLHGILQARILEWVAISFSRGSSQPRESTGASCIASGFFTDWAITEARILGLLLFKSLFFFFNRINLYTSTFFWIKVKTLVFITAEYCLFKNLHVIILALKDFFWLHLHYILLLDPHKQPSLLDFFFFKETLGFFTTMS